MDGSKWKYVNYHTWFKSMTGGPTSQEDLQPPHFTVAASSTSIPWILPEVPFLVRGNPSPPERPLAGDARRTSHLVYVSAPRIPPSQKAVALPLATAIALPRKARRATWPSSSSILRPSSLKGIIV
jgi:hypothetical protein